MESVCGYTYALHWRRYAVRPIVFFPLIKLASFLFFGKVHESISPLLNHALGLSIFSGITTSFFFLRTHNNAPSGTATAAFTRPSLGRQH